MESTKNKSFTLTLLISIVTVFIIVITVLWFFKEDINLAVVPESKAGTDLNISSVSSETYDDDVGPAMRYYQSLLDDPDNFITNEFEDMMPAETLMRSSDMFLVGF